MMLPVSNKVILGQTNSTNSNNELKADSSQSTEATLANGFASVSNNASKSLAKKTKEFTELPDDIKLEIFKRLPIKDQINFAQTSKSNNELIETLFKLKQPINQNTGKSPIVRMIENKVGDKLLISYINAHPEEVKLTQAEKDKLAAVRGEEWVKRAIRDIEGAQLIQTLDKLIEKHLFTPKAAKFIAKHKITKQQTQQLAKVTLNAKEAAEYHVTEFKSGLLGYAIGRVRLGIVEALITAGADPNAPINNNGTPLMLAIKNGAEDIVQLLLGKGVDPNFSNSSLTTPLHAALNNQRSNIAVKLIEAGANVNAQDSEGYTVLQTAISNVVDPDDTPKKTWSPAVQNALAAGRLALAAKLIQDEMMSPNAQSQESNAVLDTVPSLEKDKNIVRILLDKGANPNHVAIGVRRPPPPALHQAVYSQNKALVALLIQYGADVELQNREGKTALELAREELPVVQRKTITAIFEPNNIRQLQEAGRKQREELAQSK